MANAKAFVRQPLKKNIIIVAASFSLVLGVAGAAMAFVNATPTAQAAQDSSQKSIPGHLAAIVALEPIVAPAATESGNTNPSTPVAGAPTQPGVPNAAPNKSNTAAPTTPRAKTAAPAAPPPPPPAPAAPACAGSPGGGGTAPSITSPGGVAGTSTADIQNFSAAYNSIRAANCLQPVPPSHFRYDACMEQRLFWIAEDPSPDVSSAWGHIGSVRSDGVPSVGCDGNLAGGYGDSGATEANKWWVSLPHRASLYRPTFTGTTANVCIYYAMVHGGLPNDGASFARSAARWGPC